MHSFPLPLKKVMGNHYVIIALATIVFALAVYALLPLLMLNEERNPFSIEYLWGLEIAVCIFFAFGKYWGFCQKKPHWMLFLITLFSPFRTFITGVLGSFGISVFHLMIPLIAFCLPGLVSSVRQLPLLLKKIPYLKYLLALWVLVLLYFSVYNNDVYDNYATQSLSFRTTFALTFNLVTVLLTGSILYTNPLPLRLFDRFNSLMFWIAIVFSIVVIVAYPFHIFTVPVEGMERTNFIFTVPSQFAFYMSFLTIYLLGIYFYYKKTVLSWFPYTKFLPWVVVLTGMGMLTSLLKNATFTLLLVCLLILACHCFKERVGLHKLLGCLLWIGLLIWGGLSIFQLVADVSVIDMMTQRFENNNSMAWRLNVWNYLLDDLSPETWFTGFGLSAASAKMKIMEGFNATNTGIVYQVLYPHNDFLAYFYDLGVGGILIFLSLFKLLFEKSKAVIMTSSQEPHRALDITLVAVLISFSIFCATDNMFNMVEPPFWIMTTVLFVLSDRMKQKWI